MSGSFVADPLDDEIVIHHEPVRIPLSALPSRPPPPPGSSFATTFVIGTAAAPWFAAAWITGGEIAGGFALGWALLLLVNLLRVLRRSSGS
jgi:hypothetical protein